MKKGKKTAIIVSLVAIVFGAIMMFSVFAASGFELGTIKIGDTITYTVDLDTVDWGPDRTFSELFIDCTLSNVKFEVASDGIFRLEYSEIEGVEVDVEVEDFTWRITEKDDRGWSQKIGIFTGSSPWMTVYLPAGKHANVYVKTVSGNIHSLGEEYILRGFYASSVSGNISIVNPIIAEIKVNTTSGNISVDGVNNPDTLGKEGYNDQLGCVEFNTTSGDVYFADTVVHGGYGFTVDTVSGNIEMKAITLNGGYGNAEHFIESTSGDITLKDVDFNQMKVNTISGEVNATLKSPIKITTETLSGEVEVFGNEPDSRKEFNVKTVSGNIKISAVS